MYVERTMWYIKSERQTIRRMENEVREAKDMKSLIILCEKCQWMSEIMLSFITVYQIYKNLKTDVK